MYPIIILKYNLCYTSWTADGTQPGAFGVLKVSAASPKSASLAHLTRTLTRTLTLRS